MQTVSGLFDTYADAIKAVHALEDAGLTAADISLIANSPADLTPDPDPVAKDSVAGAELGAVLGAGGGLLAGLGIVAVPGIGPVLAGGWLVATIAGALAGAGIGAAAGGLIGVLTDAGIPKSDAHVYAEGVRRGGVLVSVRVPEGRVDAASEILAEAGSVNLEERRERYEREGWTAFEDKPVAERVEEEVSAYRDRYPLVPPVL
jgi:hypothetical protein